MKKKPFNRYRYFNRPIFTFFKKHPCPKCGNILVVFKKEEIVQHKNDFQYQYMLANSINDFIGPLRIVYDNFKCETCNIEFTVEEYYKIYREKKKKER